MCKLSLSTCSPHTILSLTKRKRERKERKETECLSMSSPSNQQDDQIYLHCFIVDESVHANDDIVNYVNDICCFIWRSSQDDTEIEH